METIARTKTGFFYSFRQRVKVTSKRIISALIIFSSQIFIEKKFKKSKSGSRFVLSFEVAETGDGVLQLAVVVRQHLHAGRIAAL